jgi:hypothetical protein
MEGWAGDFRKLTGAGRRLTYHQQSRVSTTSSSQIDKLYLIAIGLFTNIPAEHEGFDDTHEEMEGYEKACFSDDLAGRFVFRKHPGSG